MKLSEKIRIIRKARGYSQEELGYKLTRVRNSISRQAISDWENGKSEPILDNIRDLSEVLNVSYDALLNENIDLNDKETLNIVLKNLDYQVKETINHSLRYRIFAYMITIKDYIKLISYFVILVLCVSGLFISLALNNWRLDNTYAFLFLVILVILLSCISIPICYIRKIQNGGSRSSFGTLSQTHFVIIDFSDGKKDSTIYIPVSEIESMELGNGATKKHGTVIVNIKDRNKPFITKEIVYPQKLIETFNNLESLSKFHNE